MNIIPSKQIKVAYSREIVGVLLDGFEIDPSFLALNARAFPYVSVVATLCIVASALLTNAYALAFAFVGCSASWSLVWLCRHRERKFWGWPKGYAYRSPSWTPQLWHHLNDLAERLKRFESPQRAARYILELLQHKQEQNTFGVKVSFVVVVMVVVATAAAKICLLWGTSPENAALAMPCVLLNGFTAGVLVHSWLEPRLAFARIAGECWLFREVQGVLHCHEQLAPLRRERGATNTAR